MTAEKKLYPAFSRYLDGCVEIPHEEFLVLWNKWRETKRPELLEELVEAYLGMASKFAWRAARQLGIETMEAHQLANVVLIRALYAFKPERGFRFSTYAWAVFQRELPKEVGGVIRSMPPSRHHAERARTLEKTIGALTAELGREPTEEELLGALNWHRHGLAAAKLAARAGQQVSLESPAYRGDASVTLGSRLPAPDATANRLTPDLVARIERISNRMDERDRCILLERILAPVVGTRPLTVAEIGDRFGNTKQNISIREGHIRERLQREFHFLLPARGT